MIRPDGPSMIVLRASPGVLAIKAIHRRWRRAERLLSVKAIRSKPGIAPQYHRLDGLFRRACARSWAAIREDAVMKSAMRVEGTAGELAARRAA